MTIVSALKKLHKKMTGKDATGMTVATVVNSLSDNYSGGGGSSLPEPGASGNVLTSTGDGWESAAPQGGDTVTVTLTPTSYTAGTIDMDFSDMITAYDAGKIIYLVVDNTSYLLFKKTNGIKVEFECVGVSSSITGAFGSTIVRIVAEKGDGLRDVNFEMIPYAQVPPADQLADGEVLATSGGTWIAANPNVNDYIVTITNDNGTWSADKSVADIYAAHVAGKHVYAISDAGLGIIKLELSFYASGMVQFGGVITDEDGGVFTANPIAVLGSATGVGGADQWQAV